MLRGQRNFNSPLIEKQTPAPDKKGRNEALLLKRNELVISRMYYYDKVCGYSYEKCLDEVSEEVFLTVRTIQDILQKNNDLMKHLKTSKPAVTVFRDKFQHIMW